MTKPTVMGLFDVIQRAPSTLVKIIVAVGELGSILYVLVWLKVAPESVTTVGGSLLEENFTLSVALAFLIFGLCNVYVGYRIYPWLRRWRARRYHPSAEPEEPEYVKRIYGKATVVFKVNSTAKWFDVGLQGSRSVKILEHSPTEPVQPQPTNYPNQSYFTISQGKENEKKIQELEISVKAEFNVLAGDNIAIFTRKSNEGTLRVQIFDTDGFLRGEFPTEQTGEPDNFDECEIAFHMDSI